MSLEYKKRHPSMGPAQIRAQLKRFKRWRLSIKAIARVLRAHGYELVRGPRPPGGEAATSWGAPSRPRLRSRRVRAAGARPRGSSHDQEPGMTWARRGHHSPPIGTEISRGGCLTRRWHRGRGQPAPPRRAGDAGRGRIARRGAARARDGGPAPDETIRKPKWGPDTPEDRSLELGAFCEARPSGPGPSVGRRALREARFEPSRVGAALRRVAMGKSAWRMVEGADLARGPATSGSAASPGGRCRSAGRRPDRRRADGTVHRAGCIRAELVLDPVRHQGGPRGRGECRSRMLGARQRGHRWRSIPVKWNTRRAS